LLHLLENFMSKTDLSALARPSGAFAMLAIDQRESMRAMFAEKQTTPVSDQQLSDFKIAALKALTAQASGVLIDPQFAWRRAIDEKVVAPGCGLIAAADLFSARGDEIVGDPDRRVAGRGADQARRRRRPQAAGDLPSG
jgi:sulfofructosephosphate aldolase